MMYYRPKTAVDHVADFSKQVLGASLVAGGTAMTLCGLGAACGASGQGLSAALAAGVGGAMRAGLFVSPLALLSGVIWTDVLWNNAVVVEGELSPNGDDLLFQSSSLPAPESLRSLSRREHALARPDCAEVAEAAPVEPGPLPNGQYLLSMGWGRAHVLKRSEISPPLAAEKVNGALQRLKQLGGMGQKEFQSGDLSYRSYGPDSSRLRWSEGDRTYLAPFSPYRSADKRDEGKLGQPVCILSVLSKSQLDQFERDLELTRTMEE